MVDRPVKRRRRPNKYSDDLLLDAAGEVFLGRGFHEASMLEIAQRAGATKPTLYARFGGKEALYDLTLERIADSMIAHMAAAYEQAEDDTLEDATERTSAAFFGWVDANPVGFRLLLGSDQGAPTGIDHRRRALGSLTQLLIGAMIRFRGGRLREHPEALELTAAYLVGVLDYGARWAGEHDATDLSAFTARFVLRGLQGLDPGLLPSRDGLTLP